ncbi:unnamed protein product (macronuclear) [Paramecium tetraurelia]|uniref:LisH domain-containing protein ARMC9 n=1 Tax=Paramecium tetraurelia TaxID=5888 RepID=A0CG71_PARTE|nr:uncharacterized protein GSPATT00038233001 [Paramecium tetraurelia]CAK69788.1 unnamed protein product [Paramecium tetraurelia]|eukprot:XP_001437185.1 hypothetical protein (macronuclear) [Paramecium tetraurelia strain d4-2]
MMNNNNRKPQSSKDTRSKVNSGVNRKNESPQKRVQSAADKSVDSSGNLTEQLNIIVQDYLLRSNCIKTLEQFKIESQFATEQSNETEHIILGHFDRGERDKFFESWSRYIPISQRQDHDSWKLEFYIQIYFFIYPIHPLFKRKGQIDKYSINQLKTYLDTKGGDLSKTNEVLSFYALPYVKNPQTHPSFQHLFTHEWVSDLRIKLKEFIQSIYGSDQHGSVLKRLVLSKEGSTNNQQQIDQKRVIEMKQLQQENFELKKKNNQQIQALQELNHLAQKNLTEAQKKWFSLTGEMLKMQKEMLKYIESNKKIPEQVQQFKKKITSYDKFFSQNLEDLVNKSEDISLFNNITQPDHDLSEITNQQQINPVQQSIEEYIPLNYGKIIQLFTKSQNSVLIATVLQALRWRITRARSALERRSVVVAYQTHDLIGTHQRNIILAQHLMFKAAPVIQCQTLKLMNALASDYDGRTYLISNSQLIKLLIELIKKDQTDSIKRKNAIGTLQKLSLRKQSQIWMLDNDIIYVALTILQRKFNLSEYTYEYITALIMNLSLSSRGRDALSMNKELAFEVLFELIEYPNDQIRTFTNGTFYSMFSRRELRDYAYQLNIPQELPKLLSISEERFKKQIQYMIEQLESNEDDYEQSQLEEDNDVDDLEDDEECPVDDEDEDDLDNNEMVVGEELLKNEFALDNEQAEQQRQLMESIMQKELQQRSIFQEQLRDSQLEKMPIGQGPFIADSLAQINPNQKQVQPQAQAFVSRPKIPRTPPIQQYYQN